MNFVTFFNPVEIQLFCAESNDDLNFLQILQVILTNLMLISQHNLFHQFQNSIHSYILTEFSFVRCRNYGINSAISISFSIFSQKIPHRQKNLNLGGSISAEKCFPSIIIDGIRSQSHKKPHSNSSREILSVANSGR